MHAPRRPRPAALLILLAVLAASLVDLARDASAQVADGGFQIALDAGTAGTIDGGADAGFDAGAALAPDGGVPVTTGARGGILVPYCAPWPSCQTMTTPPSCAPWPSCAGGGGGGGGASSDGGASDGGTSSRDAGP